MDINFDLALCLRYILEIGDVEMEFENADDKNGERKACTYCSKTFKSITTLERHHAKFHAEEKEENEKRRLLIWSVIVDCIGGIESDLCLDDATRNQISNYTVEDVPKSYFDEVSRIFRTLKRNGDAGKFYEDYFASITQNAVLYFPNLPFPGCVTLAMKISDKLLAKSQPELESSSNVQLESENLTEMELGGLQYLAGYVIKNLIKKAKKWNKKYEPAVCELLQEFLADCPRPDQLLITAKNRGGLSAVTEVGEPLFEEIEKRFRRIVRSNVVCS